MPEQRPRARLIAFYLPQFHPTTENDTWWGKGFTEWRNVAKAKPLFEGHYQPHIPAHLGFYDLRVPEVREAQAELARRHNIEAFCYWHYWFEGRRLLDRPLDEVLASGRPDFPFCLSWANETWSRRWLGEEKSVLLKQTYSPEDDVRHARWLAQVLGDPRYVKVAQRPVFLIYRPCDLPEPIRITAVIREECLRRGLAEPYLIGINSHRDIDYRTIGFDATLDFEPQLGLLHGPLEDGVRIYDYAIARRRMASRRWQFPVYRCIFVAWDNSPRRGQDGIVFVNATAEHFEEGLAEYVHAVQERPLDDRLVFINAWNEWAEGNHLEPDLRNGLAYLEAVQRVNMADASGGLL